jgi:cytochrome oxidase Cu insertion factor (SCO1/SenC/PrrC family)
MHQIRMIAWGLILVVVAFLTYSWFFPENNPVAKIADDVRPFSLVNNKGERVTHEDFAGKYMLIFFGYSYCPDVCPTELSKVTLALELLEAQGHSIDNLQPLFITIDPERDTVQQLSDYMGLFHPKYIGLTGTAEEIAEVAKTYQIYYKKSDINDTSDTYLMDHMSLLFLLDGTARRMHMFAASTTPDELVDALKTLTDEK